MYSERVEQEAREAHRRAGHSVRWEDCADPVCAYFAELRRNRNMWGPTIGNLKAFVVAPE